MSLFKNYKIVRTLSGRYRVYRRFWFFLWTEVNEYDHLTKLSQAEESVECDKRIREARHNNSKFTLVKYID